MNTAVRCSVIMRRALSSRGVFSAYILFRIRLIYRSCHCCCCCTFFANVMRKRMTYRTNRWFRIAFELRHLQRSHMQAFFMKHQQWHLFPFAERETYLYLTSLFLSYSFAGRRKNGIWCMSANARHRTIFRRFTGSHETTVAGLWCSRVLLPKQWISTKWFRKIVSTKMHLSAAFHFRLFISINSKRKKRN